MVMLFSFGLATGLVIAPALLLQQLTEDPRSVSSLLQTMLTYGFLLFATCLTACLALTVALMAFLYMIGAIGWKPDFIQAAKRLASWSAIGSVSGAACGSLTPLISTFVSSVTTSPDSGTTSFDLITPGFLMQITAIGGILGYFCGLIAAPFALSRGAENLIYRALFGPGVFVGLTWFLASHDVSPRALFIRMATAFEEAAPMPLDGMSNVELFRAMDDDWRNIVVLLGDAPEVFLPSTQGFTLGMLAVFLVLGLGRLIRDVLKNANNADFLITPQRG